jgi:hypothetical protein
MINIKSYNKMPQKADFSEKENYKKANFSKIKSEKVIV